MANSTTQFGGFLTNVGIAQQANTAALGLPWNITHMLIGDAGGEPSQTPDPTPKPSQDALVRQVYRAQLNALYPSPADPNVLVAELVLPPEIGGWWIRELALEDASGNFIAVAKPAPSYKPLLAQGSGRTQTIRMHVVFGNQANVTLKIDPSVVLATRDYADKACEAAELYTRNQLKAHVEAADPHPQYLRRGDVAKDAGQLAWLGAATGTADALVLKLKSSEATLAGYAAGQRFQFQATATNTGAVTARINGLAVVAVKKADSNGLVDLAASDIRAGALYDLNYDGTYFQLGGGVGGGKAFERFSFEASVGQTTFDVRHSVGSAIVLRNGREVTDYQADGQKIIFRTPCAFGDSVEILAFSAFQTANSYTKAEVQALMTTAMALPVGTMLPFPCGDVPAGFLEVNGRTYSAADYPDLAAYLGGAFDKGDEGAGYFRLPDTRGEFLRGWDNGRGVDAGRVLGSSQADAFQGHFHNVSAGNTNGGLGIVTGNATGGTALLDGSSYPTGGSVVQAVTDGANGIPRTAQETRPRNLSVIWCIRAWNAPVNQGNIDVAALAEKVVTAIPKYYLYGLSLSVSAVSPTTAIDVSPGVARGAGNPIELSQSMTGVLQAVGSWTAASGGNKLDTGVRAPSNWYNVFVIQQIASGQPDLLFSLSASAPVLPPGYGLVRRIASIATNESNEIIAFINVGRRFLFQSPVKDGAGSIPAGDSTRVLTLSVPRGRRVLVHVHAAYTGTASTVYLRPTELPAQQIKYIVSNTAASLVAWGVGLGLNTSDVDFGISPFDVVTDQDGSLVMQTNNHSAGFYSVATLGYTELD